MFVELNDMCQLSGTEKLPGRCVFIEGCHGADSSFVLHHFVSLYVRADFSVCFLGLAQSFNHYNSICTKLGVSLSNARDRRSFIFLELLKLIGSEILQCESETSDGENPQRPGLVRFDQTDRNGLRGVYERCKDCVQDTLTKHPDRPLLLVVDDLSVLSLLGFEPLDVIYFVTYLRSLVSSCDGCLLVQTQCDGGAADDVIDIPARHVRHQSDCVIKTEALSTGYCRDVHGQITVYNRWPHHDTFESKRTMQYRIQEKSVKFFAIGMSSAIL